MAAELIFVLLHEAGHSLIDIYALPVLGREEDAADKIATFILLNLSGNQFIKDATIFFEMNKPNWWNGLVHRAALYGDEHSLSQQRMGNVICWGYGKDPADFATLAASIQLPARRLALCKGEYDNLNRDIRDLLGSNFTINQVATQMRTATPPTQTSPSTSASVFIKLDQITVQIKPDPEANYLEADVEMIVANAKLAEQIKGRMTDVRFSVLQLMSSKAPREMNSMEGKHKLGNEIKELVNKFFNVTEENGVSLVFFNSFKSIR